MGVGKVLSRMLKRIMLQEERHRKQGEMLKHKWQLMEIIHALFWDLHGQMENLRMLLT